MKFASKYQIAIPRSFWRRLGLGVAALSVAVVSGACITAVRSAREPNPPRETGINFDHEQHLAQGMDCTICHQPSTVRPGEYTMPGHDICGVCHEIPDLLAAELPDLAVCSQCHQREDYSVTRPRLLDPERVFLHDPHIARGLDCTECHGEMDRRPLPQAPLKPWCMECHAQESPRLNECSICHTQIDRDYIPLFRGESRIAHDAPEIWKKLHGRESMMNPQFCMMCHDQQASCQDCHSRVAPDDHTISWRRKTHGLHANWDRNRCQACHEEDFCIKCHQTTAPDSHRAGWGAPLNRHCMSCHMPERQSNCTVCHEHIDHRTAMPSPHNFGLFPPNCAACHPGGMPTRAPHVTNSSMRCVVCHS